MEPVELRDDDLLLRPWEPGDADAVYRACQDPEIQRWTTVPSPYRREHAEHYVSVLSPKRWADGTGANFGVFDQATGALLGSNGLVSVNAPGGSAEVGYWTAPWARGRSVAARSSRLIARWAFETLELRRLVWQAALGNHASRLAALRAGFRVEGRLRLAHPGPAGLPEGWVGSLLPSDLAGEPTVSPAEVRRARVFGGEQPVLLREAPGGQVTLRRATEANVDALVATCRDPEAIRWTTVPDPYERASGEFFVRHAAETWAAGTAAIFGLYDADGEFCGTMDLRLAADPAVADVGYQVSPWARGRGYGTAALRGVCEWGFGQLGLARIEWRAHVGNDASRRVAEKAGFRIEGVERAGVAHRGERRDCWVGALLPSDLPSDLPPSDLPALGLGRR